MVTPPTRVAGVTPAVGWTSNATPKTSPSFDVVNGDLIVLLAFSEDATATLGAPTWTGTGAWTLRQSVVVSAYCTAYLYTCAVTATATGVTISQTRTSGTQTWSFYASVWRNHGGLGVTGKTNVASGAPSLALSTSANSAVICGNSDWSATSPTGRTWRTVNGSAMAETSQGGVAGNTYETYTGYAPDTGPAGTTTVGLLTPSAQKYSIVAAEVLGTGSVTPAVTGSTAVGVGLSGVAVSVATAAGALALGLALSGVAVPVAVATGTLPAALMLTGTASQTSTYTVTGSTPTALALTGTASTVAAATGALNLGAGFTGQASTVGSFAATGALPLAVTLNGAASTTATVTGALPVIAGLTGAATIPTIPITTGALPTDAGLTGAANIVALTTGTLPIKSGLTGAGLNPSTERDLWLTTTPLPDRWTATPVPDRWGTAQLAPRWATTPLENLMATTILASAGAKQYVGGTVTELTGKDISSATFQVALGSIAAPPTSWSVPDVSVAGSSAAQRVVKLLVTNTTPPGTYWVWVRITDNPEIEPLTVQGPITIA